MKNSIAIFSLLLISFFSFGQSNVKPPTDSTTYCQVLCKLEKNVFENKDVIHGIEVDFGKGFQHYANTDTLKTTLQVLNYMTGKGWTLVSSYSTFESSKVISSNNLYYIMKKNRMQ